MVGELNMRHSHATHDLFNRIAEGNPPEWTWYVQTMPVDIDLAEVGFDPLDDTKVRRSAVIHRFCICVGKMDCSDWCLQQLP